MGKQSTSTTPSGRTREEYLEDQLAAAHVAVERAQDAGSHQAVFAGMRYCLQVRSELDHLRDVRAKHALPESAEAHRAELLAETRRQRMAATGVAVPALLRLEYELLISAETERRQAEQDRIAAMPLDELEAQVRAMLGVGADA